MSVKLICRSVFGNPGNRGQWTKRACSALNWQIRKRLLATSRPITLFNGRKFCAYPDCVVSSSLIYADFPEYHELRLARSILTSGDVLIDVGANVGHIGLLLSDLVNPQDIYAFEPVPVTFARLTENWKCNRSAGEPNLFQLAIGESDGEVVFPDTSKPVTVNSRITEINSQSNRRTIAVPLRRLDSFRDKWAGKKIGLLKIDVEGHEASVFVGAHDCILMDRPRLIMFESLDGKIEDFIAKTLKDANFVTFQLNERGQIDFKSSDAQNQFAMPAEHRNEVLTRYTDAQAAHHRS